MGLIDRAKNILITPKTEWDVIASEETSIGQVVTTYVLPLAIVSAAASFVGYGFIGVSGMFGFRQVGIMWGVNQAVIVFVSSLLSVFVAAYVVDMLAPSFGSQKNLGKAAQLMAYSYTPALIGGVLNVVPMLGILGSLFGLYGIYLMYLGMPKLMKTPDDKVVIYMVVSILVLVVAWAIIGFILGIILLSILGLGAVGAGF